MGAAISLRVQRQNGFRLRLSSHPPQTGGPILNPSRFLTDETLSEKNIPKQFCNLIRVKER